MQKERRVGAILLESSLARKAAPNDVPLLLRSVDDLHAGGAMSSVQCGNQDPHLAPLSDLDAAGRDLFRQSSIDYTVDHYQHSLSCSHLPKLRS